jgi:hypothetical protein
MKKMTKEKILERRAEIAELQAELQAEHRKLGLLLVAHDVDVDSLKAERARLDKLIEVSEME